MSKVYRYHFLRILEAISTMKKNEYPRPAEPVQSMMEVRKRFNVLKHLYVGDKVMIDPKWRSINKVQGIVPNKEYVIRTVYCNRKNISVSVFDSDNTFIKETVGNETVYRAHESLYDPRMFLLIDPVARIPTKITMERDENGEMVRVSKLSGTIIPKPYTNRLAGTHDTLPSDAISKSYVPSLKFPHEEIMESLGIRKSYDWHENDIRCKVQQEKDRKQT